MCLTFLLSIAHLEVKDAELEEASAAKEDHERRDGKSDGRQERLAAEAGRAARTAR